MRVLVIGGTGQSGPLIVRGLVDAGHEVVIMHSGQHEPPLPPIEHIHTDVHFKEPLNAALAGRQFDLVISMYGRAQLIADALVGKTGHLVSISGTRYYYTNPRDPRWGAHGPCAASETSPMSDDAGLDRLGYRINQTEQALMDHHRGDDFAVTILRYPAVYGPGSVFAGDWSFIRRILDGREFLLMPDGGLGLRSRLYTDNAAQAVLLTVEKNEIARGQIYHVADEPPELTIGQTVTALATALDREIELVNCPGWLGHRIYGSQVNFHRLLDTSKIREELGYKDRVDSSEALRRTALWWRDNQPASGSDSERAVGDRFDYAMEDELAGAVKAAETKLAKIAHQPMVEGHPFRHPRKEGEQKWNADSGSKLMNARFAYPFPMWMPDELA